MASKNDLQLVTLNCPHCDNKFNMKELFEHNRLNNIEFSNYINNEINLKLNNIIIEKTEEMEREYQKNLDIAQEKYALELGKKEAEIQNKVQEEVLNLKNALKQKENILIQEKNSFAKELQATQEKYALELGKKEAEIQNKVQEEVLNLKNALKQKENILIQEKNSFAKELQATQEKYALELEKQKLDVKSVYQNQILELTKSFNDKIQELKVKNAENRIINSKTKGENWELEVENELYKAFGYIDKIEKITTGDQRADYLQSVKNGREVIGKIVYEVKNAKWSDSWIEKLSVDVARNKTKYGILVATSFQEKYHGDISFIQSDEHPNIWIADPWSFVFVAQIIRKIIEIENNFLKKANSISEKIDATQKMNQLQEFIDYDMPDFSKTFRKQLEEIIKVKNSMLKTSEKNGKILDKVHDILQRKFKKLVIEKLEKIVGVTITENDNSENEEDILNQPNLEESILLATDNE